jgi:hypothetical protein
LKIGKHRNERSKIIEKLIYPKKKIPHPSLCEKGEFKAIFRKKSQKCHSKLKFGLQLKRRSPNFSLDEMVYSFLKIT